MDAEGNYPSVFLSGGSGEFSAAERRLLASMPLHAATSAYGEAGLRERLGIELSRRFEHMDRRRIGAAAGLMARLHAADRRQREPYVNHLYRVAIRVMSHYRVGNPDVVCAALLHDAVEDHGDVIAPGGSREAAFAVLAGEFGSRAAELVAAVTNPVWEARRDKHEQYREHVVLSLKACPWARVIKVSDFTDNAVGLFYTTGPKVVSLAGKYGPLVPVLRGFTLRADTPLDPDVKAMITAQLDRAGERFAAIRGDWVKSVHE
jgi:hypothetical protein